jgi:uncharacterized protein YecE (DUF72 family)
MSIPLMPDAGPQRPDTSNAAAETIPSGATGDSSGVHTPQKAAKTSAERSVAPVGDIRVGPAGWSYPDWSGYVYPSPRPKGFYETTYLAEFFDTIEINTSFYSPLQPGHAHQWLERVSANPRFLFTAKLWQKFTHETIFDLPGAAPPAPPRLSSTKPGNTASSSTRSPRADDERAVRAGFDVLRNAGKLGAVLLQFPFSFHRTPETQAHLAAILKRFADYPLAVEVRHASWDDPEIVALLCEHHAAFCNIDQPIIGNSLLPREGPSQHPFATKSLSQGEDLAAPIGYIRLHGRRYDTWFSDDPTIARHERYNYLYSVEELTPWVGRIQSAGTRTRKVFAITNNHYLGKGVVNALQLISMLKGARVNVPESLRQHYPELDKIASMPPERPTLFPMCKETKG